MSAWLGVVSRAHVRRGVAGGFAQFCHGNAQPLRRMWTGDWLVYYSPSEERGGPPLRAFTAVGQVADDDVFAFDMGGGFVPFRRRIRYVDAMDAPIDSIRHHLALCAAPNWGVTLRRGHLPLAASDFALIAAAMRAAGTGMDTA